MNTRTNHGAIVTFNLTPELAAKGYEQYGFGTGITVVEQPKPFALPALLPIQTLALEQVKLTSEMQEVVNQVLNEELQKPDPYAELKKAHAEGKVIQGCIRGHWIDCTHPTWKYPLNTYRIKPDEIPWIKWHGGECPLNDEEVEEWEYKCRDGFHASKDESGPPSVRRWSHSHYGDIIAYRVLKWREKKPKMPLGPEDVPPGSVVKAYAWNTSEWRLVAHVYTDGLLLANCPSTIWWGELQKDYKINRSIPMTGKWNPDAWEPCEK